MTKYFIVYTSVTIVEEVINREYFFQALKERRRIRITFGVIVLLFIASYGANKDFEWTNSIFFFIHGKSYCLLYLLALSVWVPFGFYLALNWTQDFLCGINVCVTVVNHSHFVTIPSRLGNDDRRSIRHRMEFNQYCWFNLPHRDSHIIPVAQSTSLPKRIMAEISGRF